MGIIEYFTLLMEGKFPQDLFQSWMYAKKLPILGNEEKAKNVDNPLPELLVFTGLVSMSCTTVLLSFFVGGFWTEDVVWIVGLSFFASCLFLVSILSFVRSLEKFNTDRARLEKWFGDNYKHGDVMNLRIDEVMVLRARIILDLEAGARSELNEEKLNRERAEMREVEQVVAKFGFTTKPWEEYFREAGGKPKEPELSEAHSLGPKILECGCEE